MAPLDPATSRPPCSTSLATRTRALLGGVLLPEHSGILERHPARVAWVAWDSTGGVPRAAPTVPRADLSHMMGLCGEGAGEGEALHSSLPVRQARI